MKFSIDKNTLQTTLQLLSKAIPTRSTLPIISCALFTHKDNNLFIRTTDLEISINLNCNVENGEDGCVAIPLNKLLEITNAMPNNEMVFNISDIGKLNSMNCLALETIHPRDHKEKVLHILFLFQMLLMFHNYLTFVTLEKFHMVYYLEKC